MNLFSSEFWQESRIMLVLVALAPALGGATGIRNALWLSGLTLLAIIGAGLVNVALKGVITPGARTPFTVVVTITLISLFQIYLSIVDSALLEELGVYLPLITVNILVLRQSVLFEAEDVSSEFRGSIWLGFKFALLLIFIGGLRELFLTGEITGAEIFARDISFFGEPGGFLIVLGALVALYKAAFSGSAADGEVS